MVTPLAHTTADQRRVVDMLPPSLGVDESHGDGGVGAVTGVTPAPHGANSTTTATTITSTATNDGVGHNVVTPSERLAATTNGAAVSLTQPSQQHRHPPTTTAPPPSSQPASLLSSTTTTSSPTSSLSSSSSSSSASSPSSSTSSSASSSCDTTCIHIVDVAVAAAATSPASTPPFDDNSNDNINGDSGTCSSSINQTATLAQTARPTSAGSGSGQHRQHHHHQRHHSTTGVPQSHNPKANAAASIAGAAANRSASQQLHSGTRSDHDDDPNRMVVLRVKSSDTLLTSGSSQTGDSTTANTILGNGSSGGGDAAIVAGRHAIGRPDIDQIRAFLESEYVPAADGCWTSTTPSALHQRDSFIHRSYNKKLLARKNAIDEIPKQQRPASMPPPAQQHSTHSTTEPISIVPSSAPTPLKRDSFLRSSLNSIRRSFTLRSSSSKKNKAHHGAAAASDGAAGDSAALSESGAGAGSVADGSNSSRKSGRRKRWTTKSASSTDEPMATTAAISAHRLDGISGAAGGRNNNSYLHGDGYALSDSGGTEAAYLNVPLENVRNYGHSRNSSTSSCTSLRSTNSSRPASMAPALQSYPHHQTHTTTGGSDSSAAISNIHNSQLQNQPHARDSSYQPQQSTGKIDAKSLKHLQTTASSTPSASGSAVARSPSPHPTKASGKDGKDGAVVPVEKEKEKEKKEKKRKELSSGRQKKFHRHFQQVAADEHVINYFSCALVSDILLQGHLYITDNYFAFYSNVFGFVTKLLIPTVSVVRISKEKTAKIIPNAIGVATADERHVFGSFMSREAAYRLMLSVWLPVAPLPVDEVAAAAAAAAGVVARKLGKGSGAESTPASPAVAAKSPTKAAAAAAATTLGSQVASGSVAAGDELMSEEFSLEDDSSSAISGNECPAVLLGMAGAAITVPDSTATATSTDASNGVRYRMIGGGANVDTVDGSTAFHQFQPHPIYSTTSNSNNNSKPTSAAANGDTTAAGAVPQLRSRSPPMPQIVSLRRFYDVELPPRLMYVGYALTALLLLLSVYLVWRIWTVTGQLHQQQQRQQHAVNFGHANWNMDTAADGATNMDVYAEVLKWQRQMQSRGADEAHIILNSNLEEIARVRKSLETLSILIHDKNVLQMPADVLSGGPAAADTAVPAEPAVEAAATL